MKVREIMTSPVIHAHANRIYVVVAGRIVQSGSYRELIDAPGSFAEIAWRQLVLCQRSNVE